MRTGTPGGWETMLESCAARDGVLRDDVSWKNGRRTLPAVYTMGFYAKHVLPRFIDLAMRNKETPGYVPNGSLAPVATF